MVNVESLEDGDIVYAAVPFHNDGSIPGLEEDALLAAEGSRGVIVARGHLEDNPDQSILLVRFEDAEKNLGPPIGAWPEELRAEADLH
ncbi:nitrogen fixation protein NifZ [Methylomagnum sp.]